MRRLVLCAPFVALAVVACSSSPQGQSQLLCYSADGDKAPPCVGKDDPRLKSGWLGTLQCITSVDDGPTFNPNPGRTPSDPSTPTCCYDVHAYQGSC